MPQIPTPARPQVSAATVSDTATVADAVVVSDSGVAVSDGANEARLLSPIALEALREAEARRAARTQARDRANGQPTELGGRQGPDPVRYGDWENGGIASDF